MFKKAIKTFVDRDEFGHPVRLNFNEQGDSYKTCLGACTSIIMKSFLLIVLYVEFSVFIKHGDDSIGFEI